MAIAVGQSVVDQLNSRGEPLGTLEISLLSSLASSYKERGDLIPADRMIETALAAAHVTGDDRAIGRALWAAAKSAQAAGDIARALELSERALAHLAEADNVLNVASLHLAHASICLQMDEVDVPSVRSELEEALATFESSAGRMLAGAALVELARCDLLEGKSENAATVAAEASRRSHGLDRVRAELVLGQALILSGDVRAGKEVLTRSAHDLQSLGAKRTAAQAWRELATVAKQAGDLELVIEALERVADCLGIRTSLSSLTTTGRP